MTDHLFAADTKAMEAELKELRRHLERKVEQRVAHLVKYIVLLESCNATLSDKLALAQARIIAIKQQAAEPVIRVNPVAQTCARQPDNRNQERIVLLIAEWQQDQDILLDS